MRINGSTKLLGLLGWPVEHSFSPAMHNAALDAAGLNYVYLPLPVTGDGLPTAVHALSALNFRGVNVTIPHKQAVMPLIDQIDPAAQAIGAVNTIVVDPAEANRPALCGFNTDWGGFLADLAGLGVEVTGRDCILFGAGGSARAVAYGLASAGATVNIFARRLTQAHQLAQELQLLFPKTAVNPYLFGALAVIVEQCNAPLIVNSTPIGMSPHTNRSIWPDALPFPQGAFVYDLVYNPTRTRLMEQAQTAGCGTANGLGMLVHQGAEAFTLWTGQEPDTGVMSRAARGE